MLEKCLIYEIFALSSWRSRVEEPKIVNWTPVYYYVHSFLLVQTYIVIQKISCLRRYLRWKLALTFWKRLHEKWHLKWQKPEISYRTLSIPDVHKKQLVSKIASKICFNNLNFFSKNFHEIFSLDQPKYLKITGIFLLGEYLSVKQK